MKKKDNKSQELISQNEDKQAEEIVRPIESIFNDKEQLDAYNQHIKDEKDKEDATKLEDALKKNMTKFKTALSNTILQIKDGGVKER